MVMVVIPTLSANNKEKQGMVTVNEVQPTEISVSIAQVIEAIIAERSSIIRASYSQEIQLLQNQILVFATMLQARAKNVNDDVLSRYITHFGIPSANEAGNK